MDMFFFFVFKQKTAYEMRISDWSSDVCSSDLASRADCGRTAQPATTTGRHPERAPESIARRGPGERSPRRPQHPCQHPFRSYGRAVALPHRKLLRRPGLRRQPPVTKIAMSHTPTRKKELFVCVENANRSTSDERRGGKECSRKGRSRR